MGRAAPIFQAALTTPIGKMVALACDTFVHALYFEDQAHSASADHLRLIKPSDHLLLDQLQSELSDYFAKRHTFFTVPLYKEQGTPFQQKAWEALLEIPYGKTWSYQEQAAFMGSPRAIRAVGSANARNPFPLLIPCHRVVRSSGELGGYACGVERKKWLLAHEKTIN